MSSIRFLAVCLAAITALWSSTNAHAQAYPTRPISIVVPYGPGSGNDMIARELAQKLTELLKVSVIVENKPGATGNIATDYVAQAKPDGYTLFLNSTSGIIYQVTNPNIKTDLRKDFAAVGFAGVLPYVVAVSPTVPAKTMADLIALAKDNPGKINYNGPPGSVSDYLGSTLKSVAGIDMVMIPYKSTADAQVDVLADRIQVWITTAASAATLAKSGKVRVLAVTGNERLKAMPDVPTISQAGIPQMLAEVTFFLLAPTGTPQSVIEKLNVSMNTALQDSSVIDRLSLITLQAKTGTPEETTKHIQDEVAKWKQAINP